MTQISSCGAAHRPYAVRFSPDGTSVAIKSSSFGDTLELFDVETGARRWKHSGHGTAFGAVTFSADGRLLAGVGGGGGGRSVGILDTVDGSVARRIRIRYGGSQKGPRAVIRPDGMRLAVAFDWMLRVHDVASGDEIFSVDLWADAGPVRYSPDGTRIATLGVESVDVWDAASGQLHAVLQAPPTYDIAFGGCSHVLMAVGKDWTVRVWDVASGAEPKRIHEAVPGTTRVMLGDDGRVAVSESMDGTVRIWDVMTGVERTSLPNPGRSVLAVCSDGTKLATRDGRKSVGIWRVAVAPDAIREPPPDGSCAECGYPKPPPRPKSRRPMS